MKPLRLYDITESRDGGQSWQKVLDKGPEIGAVDLALDPTDSHTIYATVWNARRTVWSQYAPIEGPGSGLYKSTDGGDHWTQLAGHGLPDSHHRARQAARDDRARARLARPPAVVLVIPGAVIAATVGDPTSLFQLSLVARLTTARPLRAVT